MKYVLYIASIFLFLSCDNEEEPVVVSEVHFDNIETIFAPGEFSDSVKVQLLEELRMCDSRIPQSDTSYMYAPCAPSNFKFLSFNEQKELKNSFMIQIKALSVLPGSQGVPLPVRHLMIFEREAGQLVKVNGFRGNLIGWRNGKEDEKDLMIRFYIPKDETYANCTFTWNGGKYDFASAISVDWGQGDMDIKPDVRDSVSNMIYTDLINNSLLF